jgi:hypothetical protein
MIAQPLRLCPGSTFIWVRSTDALVHAWDLAKATGQRTGLDPELATQLLAASRQRMTGSCAARSSATRNPAARTGRPTGRLPQTTSGLGPHSGAVR